MLLESFLKSEGVMSLDFITVSRAFNINTTWKMVVGQCLSDEERSVALSTLEYGSCERFFSLFLLIVVTISVLYTSVPNTGLGALYS